MFNDEFRSNALVDNAASPERNRDRQTDRQTDRKLQQLLMDTKTVRIPAKIQGLRESFHQSNNILHACLSR